MLLIYSRPMGVPPACCVLVEQRVELTTVFRRQRIAGTQRGENVLQNFTRLTVGRGEIFLQMREQQFQRFFVAPDLVVL